MDDNISLVVLVTGWRNMSDMSIMNEELQTVIDQEMKDQQLSPSQVLLVEGGAKGADNLARQWAKEHGWRVHTEIAEWAKYGPAAGPIRNRKMIREFQPHVAFAFIHPTSTGTKGCFGMLKDLSDEPNSPLQRLVRINLPN